ncbi:MAG TPA: cytochrome c oxidase subunit I, partial [Acidimicrobiales bacterium]|nr:cytochrome c oxidase subunit I [Acidimicrobiales bacterium]
TDHKVIGKNYLVTSVIFFLMGGLLAMFIRVQLFWPNSTFASEDTFNQLFTMHGTIMLLLFAGPYAFAGLANYLVPLQVGAPDMAFPRLNAFSYWLFLFGGLIVLSSFLVAGGAATFGWTAYAPMSDAINSPGAGSDMWILGLTLTGFSAIFSGINLVATTFCLRAPGLTMFRMPIFTWNMLVTAILILIAFPVLTAALVMLYFDRHFHTHIYETTGGGVPILWQHLFWFFGHPEVYILALPYFGIVTEIFPVFSRKPVFGYKGLVFATLAIAGLSTGVWAHHMFTTGVVLLPFFSAMTMLIAVPTGIKFFAWIGTMWRGAIVYKTPMLWAVAFLIVFLAGGLSGVILASPPLDFDTNNTYFVVAHFHEVLMGTAVFGGFAGIYFWYPKFTGRMLNEKLGIAHLFFVFFGFWFQTVPQYLLGLHGMPRRIAIYQPQDGWTSLNRLSSIGAWMVGFGFLFFLWNIYISWRRPKASGGNPWDGNSLEWATSSPPPHHNFHSIPPIRSERPVWDANHPELVTIGGHGGHGRGHSGNGSSGNGSSGDGSSGDRRAGGSGGAGDGGDGGGGHG